MVGAEGNQLFTDWAAPDGFPLALLDVAEHPLHLVTAVQAAVDVPALTRVLQSLDAALDAQRQNLLIIVKIKAEILHLVRMSVPLVARHAQQYFLKTEE